MRLSYHETGDIQTVALDGQINGSNADDLEKSLLAVLDKGARKVVLDFSAVDYISSAGLRVVLLVAKKLSASAGSLVLCRLQPGVFEIFEMCGFADILTIVENHAAACASFLDAR
jgi:stage II sporulation protein AA (anti-sigma F factor antagonist)